MLALPSLIALCFTEQSAAEMRILFGSGTQRHEAALLRSGTLRVHPIARLSRSMRSNMRVNRTARKLRLRVPSSLRSAAAGYARRWASRVRNVCFRLVDSLPPVVFRKSGPSRNRLNGHQRTFADYLSLNLRAIPSQGKTRTPGVSWSREARERGFRDPVFNQRRRS